jgi:acyl carrier protein
MEMQNFIKNFASQFEETDLDVFTSETNFREIEEWSSLIALSIMAMIDEEYDITINGNEMRQSQTIEDLFNLIQSKA